MTACEKINAIINYFEENEDIFDDCIEELDGYNGYLGDDRYYHMEEMKDLYCGYDPIELLNWAFFGHDSETWTTDSNGNKTYGEFNPNREYFTFNGYGNFVSVDYKDYSNHLDKYAVESMLENKEYIYAIKDNDELNALFEALKESEE